MIASTVLLTACTGFISQGGEEAAPPPIEGTPRPPIEERPIDEIVEPAAGIRSEGRRLTPTQYANAVRDLFQGQLAPGRFDIINVGLGHSGYSTDPRANEPNEASVRQLFQSAEDVAVASVDVLPSLLECSSAGGTECVDSFLDRFVARAFRRPLTSEERGTFHSAYEASRAADFSPVESFAVLIEIMLQSAPFLYVVERGEGAESPRALSTFEIAARLSFLYADSIPDDALWAAAQGDELNSAAGRRAHAMRLLTYGDARLLRRFAREWLHLSVGDKDSEAYPDFSRELAASFEEELTRLLLRGVRESLSIDEVLNASQIEVDERLADFYGISDFQPGADGWALVDLPPHYQGLFARPFFLASHAETRDTAIVSRGLAVLEQFLCAPPGSPPPNADTMEPEYPENITRRERSELLQDASPSCGGCHSQIDNVGLALENYDAIGRWRDETPSYEGGQAIDNSGWFATHGTIGTRDVADTNFEGAQGLAEALSGSEDVLTCMSRQWYRFATHRAEEDEADDRLVADIRRAWVDGESRLSDFFVGIAETDAFAYQLEQP